MLFNFRHCLVTHLYGRLEFNCCTSPHYTHSPSHLCPPNILLLEFWLSQYSVSQAIRHIRTFPSLYGVCFHLHPGALLFLHAECFMFSVHTVILMTRMVPWFPRKGVWVQMWRSLCLRISLSTLRHN